MFFHYLSIQLVDVAPLFSYFEPDQIFYFISIMQMPEHLEDIPYQHMRDRNHPHHHLKNLNYGTHY